MNNRSPSNVILVLALTATLALAGCVDTFNGDEDIESQATDGNLAVSLNVENAPADYAHLGLVFKGAFVHNTAEAPPNGFYKLDLVSSHADLVIQGEALDVEIATGNVPAGTYDQVVLQLRSIEAHPTAEGDASGNDHDDGHAHGDDDGHAHAHGDHGGAEESKAPTGAFDVPVNVTFEVTDDDRTHVAFVLDASAATEDGGFKPAIKEIIITRGGEVVETVTDVDVAFRTASGGDPTGTAPPVARTTVFGPDGAKVYEPDFLAESGQFANSKSSAFKLGDTLRFSATDSEAVAQGASLESYEWDFDDGETATGINVEHSYTLPGVWEVTLTVTDSFGVSDSHTVRVIYLSTEWTAELANTSFEEEGEWTASGSGETTWARDGPGRASDTSWHVGHHLAHLQGTPVASLYPGYTAGANATLTSPVIEIPETWSNAGFFFYLAGSSEAGFDQLSVSYTADGETTAIGTFDGVQSWTQVGAEDALAGAIGQEVQFVFTFTSDGFVETGDGWYLDDFVLGGVDLELHKAHLLEEGAHDGHDHEH